MTIKRDIVTALWSKLDFWSTRHDKAKEDLTLAQDAHVEAYKKLEKAKHNVEYYRSTREKLIAAIITIEDFINDD